MHILLLGATGRTGTHVLTELLSRQHTITALARTPSSLPPDQPCLTIIPGTPLSPTNLHTCFTTASQNGNPITAVISTLAATRTSDNPWARPTSPPAFMTTSIRNTLSAMRSFSCRKIVVLGTIGVGSSRAHSGWFFNWVVDHSNLKIAFDEHEAVQGLLEKEVEGVNGFRWVDVRATGLSNGEKKEVREWGDDGRGVAWWVSRKSVAGFLVDAVEGDKWDGRTPVISN